MPEVLLFNPRPKSKRRKHAKRRRVTHRRRRAAHNPRRHRVYAAAPRRRRRYGRRHHARRRVHHNPRLGGGQLMQGVMFGAGAIVAKVGAGFLAKQIPAAWNLDANTARIGTEAAIGIGAPMLAKKFKLIPGNLANAWLMGGIVVTVLDVFDTYVKPNIPGLADYEYPNLQTYTEPAQLMGVGDDGGEGPYGGGPY